MFWKNYKKGSLSSTTFFKKSGAGFTLIELLVVIAIIGILASMILVSMSSGREKAKVAKAQAGVKQVYMALFMLEDDSNQWPGHKTPYKIERVGDNEICSSGCVLKLSDCAAGLICDDVGTLYFNWRGPYLSAEALIDPWGNEYFLDTDYDIDKGPGEQWTVVVGSFGPDGIGKNLYHDNDGGKDNIIHIISSEE